MRQLFLALLLCSTAFAGFAQTPSYCIPPFQYDSRYAYSGAARLGTINYINYDAPPWDVPNGYFSYVSAPAPNQTTDLAQSSSQTLTITVGGNGTNSAAAWIDYNQDGDFNDPGELLGSVSNVPIGQADFTFTVPATALLGPTRLRIIERPSGTLLDPCTRDNYPYGETDDYTVNITRPCTGTSVTVYLDADGDGFGNPNVTGTVCSSSTLPHGWVTDNKDCDDSKLLYADNDGDSYGAGAPVACGVPNNIDCNDADASVLGSITLYKDSDHDGFGDPNNSTTVCPQDLPAALSAGYIADNSDCNDIQVMYADADGDGVAGTTRVACGGLPTPGLDCDDHDPNIQGPIVYFADTDKDGFGDHNQPLPYCSSTPPDGYVNNADDCDDGNKQINPSTVWYLDADNDGYYTGTGVTSCVAPPTNSGYKYTGLLGGQDCNDADAAVHPGAVEICGDGIDNNCDGYVDEGCTLPYSLSINDVSMNEGSKGKANMVFTVTLNKVFTKKVTVQYTTQNGSATAGSDYMAKSGTLTFKPGSIKQTVAIPIIGNKTVEPNETFTIVLSNPVNAILSNGTGTGTILNDDGTTLLSISSKSLEMTAQEHSIMVAPNPATNTVYATLHGYTGKTQLQLLDASGRLLKQIELQAMPSGTTQQRLDVANLTNGIYFLTAVDESGVRQTQKAVIAR